MHIGLFSLWTFSDAAKIDHQHLLQQHQRHLQKHQMLIMPAQWRWPTSSISPSLCCVCCSIFINADDHPLMLLKMNVIRRNRCWSWFWWYKGSEFGFWFFLKRCTLPLLMIIVLCSTSWTWPLSSKSATSASFSAASDAEHASPPFTVKAAVYHHWCQLHQHHFQHHFQH